MPTTLTNGIQLPDKGSVDWYSSMQSNYNLIDTHLGDTDAHVTAEDKANWNSKQGSLSQDQLDAIAQVATNTDDIATLQSGKADASHTHSSSDITDIDDYATKDYVDNSISGLVDNAPDALNTLNELSAALNDDSNFASTVTTALASKADSSDLATVATSGSYTDLDDLPTIPTNTSDLTNDSDFVVSSNLATVATSGDYDDLSNKPSIPTNTSDLTNDSNFVDSSNAAVSSGITSAKVTDYDTHIADTDIHVTTADKNRWNNQAFVFRYSSTALVASSTNSNTLLDNTDNLKVGDKVIDSSGVLFSITAIDTQNSTFTIGTALIDLAQDSDVVHKSGNETISGEKTFNDLHIVSYGTQYKGARNAYILPEFSAGYSGLAITTLGFSQTLKIGNFVLDANNKPSLDASKGYIQILTGENNGVNACVIEPRNSTSSSLGASSNKWSKIYGTEYYYGSNNVEFSTKFVTTDTAQTISGSKTFSDNPVIGSNSSNTTISNKQIIGNSTSATTGNHAYSFMQLKAIVNYTDSSSPIDVTVGLEINEDAYADGRRGAFFPSSNNATNLGKSGKRWANVYATNYYYGGSEVEFSTKFVTTDTNQTISGSKTFSDNLTIYNNDSSQSTKNLTISSSKIQVGDTSNSDAFGIRLNAGASYVAQILAVNDLAGTQNLQFSVRTKDSLNNFINSAIRLRIFANGNSSFEPGTDDSISLGSGSLKYKDVRTNKVNGVEPSSLSLPSGNLNDFIDISSYFSNPDTNSYTASANGWIYLRLGDIDSCQATIFDANNNRMWGQSSKGSVEQITIPILKGQTLLTQWNTSSTVNIAYARFIPCQGNV